MIAGIAFALGSAVATNAGFLLKRRGAIAAEAVTARHPLRSAAQLFRSRWWTIGWLVALGAWLLHIGALALAPLSIVQAVLSGGLVLLAVLAGDPARCSGERDNYRQAVRSRTYVRWIEFTRRGSLRATRQFSTAPRCSPTVRLGRSRSEALLERLLDLEGCCSL